VVKSVSEKAQEALKLSEEQFRRAVEDSPIPMIMQAEDGEVLHVSRSFTELTGYGVSDVPTFDNWVTKTVYDGAEAVRDHMHKLFEGHKRSINVSFTVRSHKYGIREWSFSASSPGTLSDGRRFIVGMAVDVTEQEEAEEALRKSEEQFREFITRSSGAVYLMSADWSVMRQLEGKDFIADTLHPNRTWLAKYILPNDRKPVLETIKHAIETKSMFEMEHRVPRVDGSIGWTWSRAVPLLDKSGAIVEWIGTAVDITARKKAEQILKRRLKNLEEVKERLEGGNTDLEEQTMTIERFAEQRRAAAVDQTTRTAFGDVRFLLLGMTSDTQLIREEVKNVIEGETRQRILDYLASMEETVGYIGRLLHDNVGAQKLSKE